MKALLSSCWRSSAATQWLVGSLAGSGSAGLRPRPSRAQTSRLGLGLRLSLTLSLSLSVSGQPLAAPQRAWQSFCSLLDCWWSHCSTRPPRASRRRQPVAGAREGGGEQTVALHCWVPVTEELPTECTSCARRKQ